MYNFLTNSLSNFYISKKNNTLVIFITLLIFLYFYKLYNGYILFYPDTERYLQGINLKFSHHSNLAIGIIFIPLFKMFGFVGWYYTQLLISAYVLSIFKTRVLPRIPISLFLLSLFVSMYGFVVLTLIVDFFSYLSILCLILIYKNKDDFLSNLILLLSIAAHTGNLILIFFLSISLGLIYKKKKKTLFILSFIIFSIFINGIYAYLTINKLYFSIPVKYTILSARIISNGPYLIEEYSNKYPNSFISKHKNQFLKNTILNSPESVLWGINSPIYKKHSEFENEAKHFVIFTLKNNLIQNIYFCLYNSYRQFLILPAPVKIYDEWNRDWYLNYIKTYNKSDLKDFNNSLFIKDMLKEKTLPLSYLCRLINFFSLILSIYILIIHKNRKNHLTYVLSLLSVLTILITIITMPNLSSTADRYLLRIIPISILSFCVNIYYLFKVAQNHNILKSQLKI